MKNSCLINLRLFATLTISAIFSDSAFATEFDIEPCSEVVEFRGEAYFCGDHHELGRELFRSNGTREGTFVVRDIDDGPGSSDPRDFFIINDHLYFFAETANTGRELYTTNGNREFTRLIRDTIVGPDGQQPFINAIFGDNTEKYFLGPNSEIWRTDGTHSGTAIAVSPNTDFNGILGYIDGDLIYSNGIKLFRINSISNEPILIHTFEERCRIRNLVTEFQFGSVDPVDAVFLSLFCPVHTLNTSNYSAWITDGTSAGTSPIPGFATGLAIFFGELNERHYFEVLCNIRDCEESLVHTDGYSTTTVINGENRLGSIRGRSVILNNELVFDWNNETWLTDGTERNTRPLTDFSARQAGRANLGDNIVFFQGESFDSRNELWISDGTVSGTRRNTSFGASNYVAGQTIGNKHYFLLDSENGAIELWVIDSSLAPPRKLAAFSRNTRPPTISFNLTAEGQRLYFRGSDRIWHSDGTVGETFPLIYTSPEVFQGPVMPFLNAIYHLLMDDDEEQK